MPLAFLTFFTGLAISAVAIYYSVIGLAAIFAAAVVPIMVMGTILEVSKLVAAWWLKANWYRAPFLLKSYMLVAVVVLMLITSMGIFGFLSKAHTDQAVPLGDTASQVAFIDEKINNERETIAAARNLIKQLDDAVVGIQSGQGRELRNRDGTTRIENPAERALAVRRSQATDRAALTKTIEEAQARIVALQEEKAPIASKLRAVEAEVGPIKYIATLIYGDNPDKNLLEKAVVWVIIIIVLVFDPLAVLLLLASQMSFRWAQEERENRYELVQENTQTQKSSDEPEPQPSEPVVESNTVGDQGVTVESVVEQQPTASSEEKLKDNPHSPGWAFTTPLATTVAAANTEENVVTAEQDVPSVHISDVSEEPVVEEVAPDEELVEAIVVKKVKPAVINLSNKDFLADDFDLTNVKFPKKPFRGQQIQLDPEDNDSYYIFNGTDWVHSPVSQSAEVGYRQNSEQSESTIWSRIQDKKNG
jgi:hypothetical protein